MTCRNRTLYIVVENDHMNITVSDNFENVIIVSYSV